jgi:hypothetical protein
MRRLYAKAVVIICYVGLLPSSGHAFGPTLPRMTTFLTRQMRSSPRACMGAGPPKHDAGHKSAIDENAYEAERLSKDAEAMKQMQEVMARATDPSEVFQHLRNPWKWAIRKRVWDYMEASNIARNPRPVHHRIPNFEGADLAAANVCRLPEFQGAKVIFDGHSIDTRF